MINSGETYSECSAKAALFRVDSHAGEGMVLLLEDPSYEHMDLPGGHLHKGETSYEAVKREIREEIGQRATSLAFVVTFENHERKKTIHGFAGEIVEVDIEVPLGEAAKPKWVRVEDVAKDIEATEYRDFILQAYSFWLTQGKS